MQRAMKRQLMLAINLGAVLALGVPCSAGVIVGHSNQDRPSLLHHNQDNMVPPNFDLPELPEFLRDSGVGWTGIQEPLQRAWAPGFPFNMGGDLEIDLVAPSGPNAPVPKVVSASPGDAGFGGSSLTDLLDVRTSGVPLPRSGGLGALVPAPGALSLLGLAFLSLAGRKRRRMARRA